MARFEAFLLLCGVPGANPLPFACVQSSLSENGGVVAIKALRPLLGVGLHRQAQKLALFFTVCISSTVVLDICMRNFSRDINKYQHELKCSL